MTEKPELDSQEHPQLIKYAEDVSKLYQDLKKENDLLRKANHALVISYYQTVLMGFDLISLCNEFLGGHSKRVARYAGNLAEALAVDEDDKINIKLAALLHDMGLIGVPQKTLINILSGKERSAETLGIYRQHPNVNIRPITSNERFKDIADIIRAHHENMDGSGFPNGLKGYEIPVESRIIAIVNGYDLVKQLNKKAIDPEKVISEMEKDVGTKYDINIFGTFKKIIIKQDPFTDTINISLDKLSPDMVLAKPIIAANGIMLLSAETEIREDHIVSIKKYTKHHKSESQIIIYKPK